MRGLHALGLAAPGGRRPDRQQRQQQHLVDGADQVDGQSGAQLGVEVFLDVLLVLPRQDDLA